MGAPVRGAYQQMHRKIRSGTLPPTFDHFRSIRASETRVSRCSFEPFFMDLTPRR